MKPFDFNIHPNFDFGDLGSEKVESMVLTELTCKDFRIFSSFKYQFELQAWSDYISGFNCMIFTSYFHEFPEQVSDFVGQMNQLCEDNSLCIEYTFLANPAFSSSLEPIFQHWADAGVRFIKFHSYHQKISEGLIPKCVDISKKAEENGMGICIDASYGSLGLYRYDNLRLASEILLEVKNVPVVILHAGGLRCYEAVLIASSSDNAFIELSFSPHFYADTSMYQSFVDMFKILSPSRFLYASDYPYIDFPESLRCAEGLFLDAGLSASEIQSIFSGNASRIFADNNN